MLSTNVWVGVDGLRYCIVVVVEWSITMNTFSSRGLMCVLERSSLFFVARTNFIIIVIVLLTKSLPLALLSAVPLRFFEERRITIRKLTTLSKLVSK